MKLILTSTLLLLLLTVPAFSELTPADINKIRLIVKEEVEASEARMGKSIAASEARLRKEIAASEARLKDQLSLEISKVNVTIAEMDKRLSNIFTLVIALMAFIAVVIGIPQIIVAMQRKDRLAQNEKIEAQQKQIEALLEQMETLRQEGIVRS